MAVQWLGLGAFTAEGPGSVPGRGGRGRTKIPQAVRGSQTNKRICTDRLHGNILFDLATLAVVQTGDSRPNDFSLQLCHLVLDHGVFTSHPPTPFLNVAPILYSDAYRCGLFMMAAVVRMGVRRRDGKDLVGKVPKILLRRSGQFGEVGQNSCGRLAHSSSLIHFSYSTAVRTRKL